MLHKSCYAKAHQKAEHGLPWHQDIDAKRGGSDGCFLGAFGIGAYIFDVGVLKEAAFCCFEDGDGR